MKKITLFLTALLMMVGNGFVKADNIQVSTTEPGNGTPEYGYTMQTYPNDAINGNRFVGENLTPSEGNDDKAYLVFYSGTKGTNSYYIYNYSQSKWLSYSSVANGKDKIEMVDSKSDAQQFCITSVSGKSGYYQLQPYNGSNPATFYVNYYQGFDNNNTGNNRLGFWQDNGNNDTGSAWQFASVTLPTSSIIITDESQLTNEKVYTLHTVNFVRGKAWYANTEHLTTLTNDFGSAALNPQITYNEDDQYQQFAFISADDGATHYLYSKGRAKFVNIDGSYSDKPVNPIYLMKQSDNTFVLKFDNSHFLNMGGSSQPIIDGWGPGGTTSGSSADEGNKLVITEVADFEPADALSKFGPTPEEFDAKFELLIEYLNKSSKYVDGEVVGTVGYPTANSAVVAEMNTFYNRIMNAGYHNGTYTYNSTDYQDVVSLITSYESSTEVKFPENGKAYRIKAKYNDGTYRYIYRTAEGKMQVATTEPSGYDGTFIFRNIMGETYALVNNKGEYMVYYADGKSGVGSTNDGFADQYECGDFDAEVTFVTAVDKTATSGTKDNWLGAFLIKARNVSSNTYFYLMAGNPDFHSAESNSIFYSGNNRSSVFYLEEVTYPNTPKLNAVAGSELMSEDLQSSTMGTFSAPFATVVPAGVTAYYVTAEGKNNDYAQITTAATEGQAIPANQGVILVGSEAGNVVMLPATTESPVTISNNQLGNTAGAAKSLAGQGHYILMGGAQGAGFYNWASGTLAMNKAYLDGSNVSAANAMKLVWNAETTGIETLVPATDVNAPIYDLSGRRVLNTVKGGVYIQNGKKFIVK